jgi:hypothetical protein
LLRIRAFAAQVFSAVVAIQQKAITWTVKRIGTVQLIGILYTDPTVGTGLQASNTTSLGEKADSWAIEADVTVGRGRIVGAVLVRRARKQIWAATLGEKPWLMRGCAAGPADLRVRITAALTRTAERELVLAKTLLCTGQSARVAISIWPRNINILPSNYMIAKIKAKLRVIHTSYSSKVGQVIGAHLHATTHLLVRAIARRRMRTFMISDLLKYYRERGMQFLNLQHPLGTSPGARSPSYAPLGETTSPMCYPREVDGGLQRTLEYHSVLPCHEKHRPQNLVLLTPVSMVR